MYSVFWTPYIVREHFPAVALAERGSLNVADYLGWTDEFSRDRGAELISTTIREHR